MSAQHAALNNADILAEVVNHFLPARQQEIAELALVSHVFRLPATKALWAELPSLRPLLLLLPEFYRLFHGPRTTNTYGQEDKIRLSEPVSPAIWALFRDRAALVRIIDSKTIYRAEQDLADESWSHLARLHGGAGPLFPSLRSVGLWYPSATGEDLRLLSSPLLQFFRIGHSPTVSDENKGRCALAVQDMFANAPTLTEFGVISCDEDLFAQIAPEALVNLSSLRFFVDSAADYAPEEWYPNAASLRVLASLPALEYLCVELGRGYRASNVDFTGFSSLTELEVVDCGDGDVVWFLARCSSPRLSELTIDLTNLNVEFQWENMHPLFSNMANGAPLLQSLVISFGEFYQPPEQYPDMLLAATHPLFALRHFTSLTLYFNYGEILLSDAFLESFAEACPGLTDFDICFQRLHPAETNGLHLCPMTVTMRSLRSFARHCPDLRSLHIPHIYVPLEACADDTNDVSEEPHWLSQLAVCRAVIGDVHECGRALSRIFPHLDVDDSRKLYLRAHSDDYNEEIRPFITTWLNMLDAYEGCPTPADTDFSRSSSSMSSGSL